jgi:hypothetical protein
MRVINGQEMLDLLEKAVAERGDSYVYPDTNSCMYLYDPEAIPVEDRVDDDGKPDQMFEAFGDQVQPACAVGLALSYKDWALLNWISDRGLNTDSFWEVAARANDRPQLGVRFTQLAADVADAMQGAQDSGLPWGEALIKAKDVFANASGADE